MGKSAGYADVGGGRGRGEGGEERYSGGAVRWELVVLVSVGSRCSFEVLHYIIDTQLTVRITVAPVSSTVQQKCTTSFPKLWLNTNRPYL